MSPLLLGILKSQAAGAAGGSYWISLLGDTSNDYAYGVTTDSSNNVIVAGRTTDPTSGVTNCALLQLDPDGVPLFQKALSSASTDYWQGVATDSSDNIYALGRTNTSGKYELLLGKFNSSGSLQWQRTVGYSTENEYNGYQVVIDSAGDVYIGGAVRYNTSGSADFMAAKFNSAGTLQWKRIYGGNSDDTSRALAIDSNDNLYIAGYSESYGAGYRDVMLIQCESTYGTPNWTRTLGASNADDALGLATDSAGNIYVSGAANDGTYNGGLLAKFNSSGTLQWQRIIPSLTTQRVAVDTDDNVYQVGYSSSGGLGGQDAIILKFNSSGTLQWQRALGDSENSYAFGITIDSLGDLVVAGYAYIGAGGQDMMLARLPADGSLTGTYLVGSYEVRYLPSSLSIQASSLTASSQTINSSTYNGSVSTSSLTESTLSLIQSITGGSPTAQFVDDATLPLAEEGAAYSHALGVAVSALGVSVSYSLLSGSVPSGMTFNASTGVISGTSQESAGTTSVFTVRAVTSDGLTVDKEFTLPTVMQPKVSGDVTVINVAPYTDQYYLLKSTGYYSTPSLTNVDMVLVGGGASGTYPGASSLGSGGRGGYVTYLTGLSISNNSWSVTIGSGGGYSFGPSSNSGNATYWPGYSANGGSGTSSGTNGSNSAASLLTPIATALFGQNIIDNYTGLDIGYLGGSGSGATNSSTPATPGLGGGGLGISGSNSAQAGASYAGGGGGGGGGTSYGSSAGPPGGRGSIIIKVPNQ